MSNEDAEDRALRMALANMGLDLDALLNEPYPSRERMQFERELSLHLSYDLEGGKVIEIASHRNDNYVAVRANRDATEKIMDLMIILTDKKSEVLAGKHDNMAGSVHVQVVKSLEDLEKLIDKLTKGGTNSVRKEEPIFKDPDVIRRSFKSDPDEEKKV